MAKNKADDYQTFWNEFGQVMKEGPAEDAANKESIAKLLRFASTHTDSDTQDVSLEQYIERMKDSQDKIYYVVADSFIAAKNSPHLEIFRKKALKFYYYDRVDEWMMSHLTEFGEKQFQSITRGDLDLGKLDDEETKKHKKSLKKKLQV